MAAKNRDEAGRLAAARGTAGRLCAPHFGVCLPEDRMVFKQRNGGMRTQCSRAGAELQRMDGRGVRSDQRDTC